MNIKKLLFELTKDVAIPGMYEKLDNFLINTSKEAGLILNKFNDSSLGGRLKMPKKGYPSILLEAHLDEIGFLVSSLEKGGFLKVEPCGGVDKRILSSYEVIIHGKRDIYGVITSIPPHLSDDSKISKSQSEDIIVDTGLLDDNLKKYVSLGDRVSLLSKPIQMLNDVISSKSIDNRAGVAALLLSIEEINKLDLFIGVNVLFANQEETTSSGAKTGGFALYSDYAIVVDTSFAYSHGLPKQKCGQTSNGPMIGVSPILDREMFKDAVNLAHKKKIPHQIEVMGSKTSTDADALATTKRGIKTALFSIPIKNMHTPIESVQIDDIENTKKLIVSYLKHLDRRVKNDKIA